MLTLFISALALGFLFNAAPGAIFAATLRRGMRGGFAPALAIQIGSLVGDFVWAVLGLLGAAVLITLPGVEIPLGLAGALLLAWLAYGSIRDALRPMPLPDETGGETTRSDFTLGAALSLSNPMNITYWAGLGGTITALGADAPTGAAFTIFLGGFMTSSVLWCFICAGAIAFLRRRMSRPVWVMLNAGCGAGLAYFAFVVVKNLAIRHAAVLQ